MRERHTNRQRDIRTGIFQCKDTNERKANKQTERHRDKKTGAHMREKQKGADIFQCIKELIAEKQTEAQMSERQTNKRTWKRISFTAFRRQRHT